MSSSHALTAAPPRRWRLIQRAPGVETSTTPDHGAGHRGMAIALGSGLLFWGAVAALALSRA